MAKAPPSPDESWSSTGLARREAIDAWSEWAASTIAPIEVDVFDPNAFAARWISHGIGQLRLLHLYAPAQRVTHVGADRLAMRAAPSIQLVYSREGTMHTRMGGRRFDVEPGQFVLLDNTRFYQMEMATPHECIDLMMPQSWLERHLPDPARLLAQPFAANAGWGAPLGALIETILDTGLDNAPLPRPLIAEQFGSLLALATSAAGGDTLPSASGGHRSQLATRILRRIEANYADVDLSPEKIAGEEGISKRYLQSLLAARGTSFIAELNATRLERASTMLTDPRLATLPIAELAFRTGFLDPGYFTRLFRKRFGITPSQWRGGLPPQS